MSKYTPLRSYLKQRQEKSLTLSFEQIEKLLGAPLPNSPRNYRQWWANTGATHTQALSWTSVGYSVVAVQLGQKGYVTFRKSGPNFWQKLTGA